MELQFRRAVAEARGNGRTVFLCSHQLAEVGAVGDRVAIPRADRLVDVATGPDLRRLHRSEVTVRFTGAAPELAEVPGVDLLDRTGRPTDARRPAGRAGRAPLSRRRDDHHLGLTLP